MIEFIGIFKFVLGGTRTVEILPYSLVRQHVPDVDTPLDDLPRLVAFLIVIIEGRMAAIAPISRDRSWISLARSRQHGRVK